MADGDNIQSGEVLNTTVLLNTVFPVHSEQSERIDLSAATVTRVALHLERACTLKKATLLYTEASSSNTGVTIELGKESDRDYYYVGTSEVSKPLWYSKDLALLNTDVVAGDSVTIYCLGGKVGTGEITLILEYYYTT